MPDQTARDAVRECFCGSWWCRAHGCPTFTICNAKADAVLAALGIPPDTPADRIVVLDDAAIERAARAIWSEAGEVWYHGPWEKVDGYLRRKYLGIARAALAAAEERDDA